MGLGLLLLWLGGGEAERKQRAPGLATRIRGDDAAIARLIWCEACFGEIGTEEGDEVFADWPGDPAKRRIRANLRPIQTNAGNERTVGRGALRPGDGGGSANEDDDTEERAWRERAHFIGHPGALNLQITAPHAPELRSKVRLRLYHLDNVGCLGMRCVSARSRLSGAGGGGKRTNPCGCRGPSRCRSRGCSHRHSPS
jgi:hypothetical protein